MRKARAKAIRQEELQNPNGMSSATYRAAKRRYFNGLNRVEQPNPVAPMGHPGFPGNTVQSVKTWAEKQPRVADIHVHGKGDKRRVVTTNRRKNVTRVISRKKKQL